MYGSATLLINEKVKSMWENGENIYQLGFGESRFPVHHLLATALADNASKNSYVPLLGINELRQKVSQFYNNHFNLITNENQIIIGVGSKSLLYAVMYSINGDVILPIPAWVSYKDQAELIGRRVVTFQLDSNNGFKVSISNLEKARQRANPGPCMLVLTNPNNPTGTILSKHNVEEISQYCRENQIYILSDEIYSLLTYEGFSHTSPATYYPEGTIVLGGLSKILSLGGWRIGVAVVPDNHLGEMVIDGFCHVAGSIWSCVPAPLQHAAITAYQENQKITEFIQLCNSMHQIRTRYLYEQLIAMGIPCNEPKGAFYIYPNFYPWAENLKSKGIQTDQDLSLHLLDHYEIATLAGTEFLDSPGNYSIRMATSYIDAENNISVKNIVKAYQSNSDPQTFIQDHHPRLKDVINRLGDFISTLN